MSENSSNHEAENEAENAEHDSHPKPKYDDVNMPVVVLLSILSAILTFVIIAFVQGLYYSWTDAMVREDWNSKVVTPQQQVVADQKAIRDGFYETKSGEIYVSVDTAAKKLIAAKGSLPSPKKAADGKQAENSGKQNETKGNPVEDPKPKPPGPDEDKKKAEAKNEKVDPAKAEKKADAGDKKEEKKD